MGKWCLQASSFIFDRIFVKLAGNQDWHKIWDEFEFRPDWISHFGVTCPWGWIKFSIDILWNLQVHLTSLTLEFFVTLFSGTERPRRFNLVHMWAVGRCIMYTGVRLLLLICLFFYFFIFLSLQFSTLKFFVTLFSGTVRPRRLKLGTLLDSRQMYHVYRNQAAAAYSSLYFFLSNFQHWNVSSHFSQELWGLEDWKLIHIWTVGSCIMYTRIRLLLLIHPFISSFLFLSNFQHWNFSSNFSQKLWGLEDWNFVHT